MTAASRRINNTIDARHPHLIDRWTGPGAAVSSKNKIGSATQGT
jgi:hypothetical protein